jgi:threonine dehydratase
MNLVGGGTFGRIMANGSGNISISNTRYYHITDHLGSTRVVVTNSGGLVDTHDYNSDSCRSCSCPNVIQVVR